MSRDREPYVAFQSADRREKTIKQRRLFLDQVSRSLKVADPSMSDDACAEEAKRLWKERMKHGRGS